MGLNKIFGIGLSKTGTTSLALALKRLGFSTIDFPHDPVTLAELERGEFRLSVLKSHQAATDTAVAIYYAQLDQIYTGSRFILTVREKESWLRSVEEHFHFRDEWAERHEAFRRFSRFITPAVYGVREFQRERFSFVYDQHIHNVMNYFRERPDDLLVLNVCQGEGYDRLCPFLGVPMLSESFPRANTLAEKAHAREWMHRLDAAIAQVERDTAPGARILLLDDWQLAGTRLGAGRHVGRISDEGGRPAESRQAARMLSRALQRDRPDYVVAAWTAYWWLEHYPDLSLELATLERVSEGPEVIIFQTRFDTFDDREPTAAFASDRRWWD
jgi:hypothetical protein